MLPFTHEQFIAVFVRYNEAIWPGQVLAYAVGLAVIWMLVRPGAARGRLVLAALALGWLWTGVAYHWWHFAAINAAAFLFGGLFVLQAGLLAGSSVAGRLTFAPTGGARSWAGWGLIAYAMVLYPIAGLLSGQQYPGLPMFGVTPCPLTLFTFGVLLLARSRVPWWLLVVPFAWSLVGGSAAVVLRVPQDWVLLFSGLAAVVMLIQNRRIGASGGKSPAPGGWMLRR